MVIFLIYIDAIHISLLPGEAIWTSFRLRNAASWSRANNVEMKIMSLLVDIKIRSPSFSYLFSRVLLRSTQTTRAHFTFFESCLPPQPSQHVLFHSCHQRAMRRLRDAILCLIWATTCSSAFLSASK